MSQRRLLCPHCEKRFGEFEAKWHLCSVAARVVDIHNPYQRQLPSDPYDVYRPLAIVEAA